jgi:toxin secretion/phage lysis holin
MKWDKLISSIIAVCGSVINYLWGGWDLALKTLLLFMALDYMLGVICGYQDRKLSSETAFKGIIKKITMLIIVAVAVSLDNVINAQGLIRGLSLFYYIGTEGISILENSGKVGIPIPEKLRDALIQLKEGNKKEVK